MDWTQPVCEARFHMIYGPDREPHRLQMPEELRGQDLCCFCQQPTDIYIRIDPATVPYPMKEEEDED